MTKKQTKISAIILIIISSLIIIGFLMVELGLSHHYFVIPTPFGTTIISPGLDSTSIFLYLIPILLFFIGITELNQGNKK